MRDIQETIWLELKAAVEDYVKALEDNTDLALIQSLAGKIKELEKRLGDIASAIMGVFFAYGNRPDAIVHMHLAETPESV